MDQIILCRSVPRRWVSPRLMALLPQRETLDNHGFQINPPGFHLVVLPFIGKVRTLQLEACAKDLDDDSTFEEAVQRLSKIMEKLELSNGFAPQEVNNPWLQKHYVRLQALVLGQKVAEDVPDQTLPNVEFMMEPTGDQLAHLTSILPINEKMHTKETLSKRKNKEKQLIESTDSTINEIVEPDLLKQFKVEELKEYLLSVGKRPRRLKPDLIDQVISHNSRSQ